ncbi:MAG: hybrid sensor histidine kinase/response regulator [Deltaproteobacteria bacterium]|nr:MAG: hybrid sensor histidine kinase/response regulator [Deltaproteobacteria bacterium]
MKYDINNLFIKSPQILIIDDSPEDLEQVVAWLGQRPCQLYQARTGEQAQKVLSNNPIDAVVTDWHLPGLSGLDLIAKLREGGFRGPLLMCTGVMLSAAHLKQAFDAGADDYLRKPLNGTELYARLDSALQLYAQRQVISNINQSQARFIQLLSTQIGTHLSVLNQRVSLLGNKNENASELRTKQLELTQQFKKLMDWGRYRQSLQYVQLQHFPLKHLLQSLEQHFASLSHRLFFRGGSKLSMYTEPDILKRVLLQLLDNALSYTTGPVTLKIVPKEQTVQIRVEDQGDTLTEGDLARLVEEKNTGLGLEICHDLLSLLGTTLQAKALRKQGSVFFFDLVQV